MPRPERKRLAVDVPIELYERLKQLADRRSITITRQVIKMIIRADREERELEK